MKLRNQIMKYNLQLFAEKKKGNEEDKDSQEEEDEDDDQDEEESEQSEKKKKPKVFTQEELDEAIEKRLKRERKKASKVKGEDKDKDNKTSEKDDKVQALEAKIICLERGIKKESVSDVVTLAKAYIDEETDLEEAIEMVIEKYPHFAKTEDKKEESDSKQKVKGKDPNNRGKKTHDQAKNPWSKEHFNLTEQARLLREEPELAEQFKASAQ